MTAQDDKDGDLTSEVFVEKVVPVSKKKAVVYYGVTDKAKNVGTASREVTYQEAEDSDAAEETAQDTASEDTTQKTDEKSEKKTKKKSKKAKAKKTAEEKKTEDTTGCSGSRPAERRPAEWNPAAKRYTSGNEACRRSEDDSQRNIIQCTE